MTRCRFQQSGATGDVVRGREFWRILANGKPLDGKSLIMWLSTAMANYSKCLRPTRLMAAKFSFGWNGSDGGRSFELLAAR
jgi:hypothetical protein